MLSVLGSGTFAAGLSVHCSGVLVSDPTRTGPNGKPVIALLQVASRDAGTVEVSVLAFRGSCCRTIMALKAGQTLAVTGRAKLNHHGLSIVAAEAISVYSYQRAVNHDRNKSATA